MISQAPILRSHYESDEKYNEALTSAQNIVENFIRDKRNALLVDSDWTQFNDSPLTAQKKTEWASYRTQLRDLIQNLNLDYAIGFTIDDESFPAKPE